MSEKTKKRSGGRWLVWLVYLAVGLAAGLYSGNFLAHHPNANRLAVLAAVLVALYVAMLLQVIVHEAGHLVFGRMSGYRFVSFRILNIMLVRQEERLRFKRFSLAGTAGQCLMAPPELRDGRMPYVLYNLGGVLMNLLVSLLFVVLLLVADAGAVLNLFFLFNVLMGMAMVLTNGIPLRVGGLDNDGYNALHLGQSRSAVRGFWIQLRINEQIGQGVRLKDMPEEWFAWPSTAELQNPLIAGNAVLTCNRDVDRLDFSAAAQHIQQLLDGDGDLAPLHRHVLLAERIYIALISGRIPEAQAAYEEKAFQKFLRGMLSHPSVIRLQYAYALLAQHDEEAAQKQQERFEKVARSYPNACEIEGERELLAYARQIYEKGSPATEP